jgi:hypothetical protein
VTASRTGAELIGDFVATFGIEYRVLAVNEPSAVGIAAGYALPALRT